MLLKLIIFLFLFPSALMAQNYRPLIATDNAAQTCNSTRMVFTPGSLSCSGSTATVTSSGGGSPGGSGTELQYRGGASTFSAVTGSAVSGGNIGIGSTNPGQVLDVQGTMRASTDVKIGALSLCRSDGTNCPAAVAGAAGNVQEWQFNNGGNLGGVFRSYAAASSGNVGLGTTASPGGTFEVTKFSTDDPLLVSTVGKDGDLFIVKNGGNVGIGTWIPGSTLDTVVSTAVGGVKLQRIIASDYPGVTFLSTGGNHASSIFNNSNGEIVFSTNGSSSSRGTDGMTFDTAQNLGIGVGQPVSYKLDVNGGIHTAGNVSIGTTSTTEALYVNGNIMVPQTKEILMGRDKTAFFYADSDTNGNIAIYTGSAEQMRVTNGGNVGIGSTNPGTKLDIQGTTRTTGFQLSTNPSAGYVLTSNTVGVGTWMPAAAGGGGGSGTVTSVTLATPNSTLSLGGTNPVTTSGTINADINLANKNNWTVDQQFSGNVGIGTTFTTTSALTVMNGNVGIGTWKPTQILTVANGQYFQGGVSPRVVTVADATSITPNSTNTDVVYQLNTQGAGTLTINADTGSPVDGQRILLKIKSTNAQTLSWNSQFVAGSCQGSSLPTTTTGGSLFDYFPFIYDATVNSKWDYTAGCAQGF